VLSGNLKTNKQRRVFF